GAGNRSGRIGRRRRNRRRHLEPGCGRDDAVGLEKVEQRTVGSTVRPFEASVAMGVKQLLETLTEELIESHARCPHPYVLSSGPCTSAGEGAPLAGVYMLIDSEIFGRMASASAKTWEGALLKVCEELVRTRRRRWAAESRWFRAFVNSPHDHRR